MNFNSDKFFSIASVLTILVLSLTISFSTYATHIRAGQITVQRISPSSLTYRIVFVGFRDSESGVEFGNGFLNFGDGNVIETSPSQFTIEELPQIRFLQRVTFTIEHTYQAPGYYKISYTEQNRNNFILNINNGNSVDIPFHVETQILIDPFLGVNSTPQLLIDPLDFAIGDRFYIHNPGAFDAEGDSIAYKFVTPKQGVGAEVPNFVPLDDPDLYFGQPVDKEDGTTPPDFSLDPITGDLIWDAPPNLDEVEFNVAFIIEEWRKVNGQYIRIGFVTRDMQIIVIESDNERPELIIPEDTCITAGTTLSLNPAATATDPDGDEVKIEAFGGPFVITNSPATYSPKPATWQFPEAELDFDWNTNCFHIRQSPWEIVFKVSDRHTINGDTSNVVSLVDFKTWQITVVGPPPNITDVFPMSARSIQLNWDEYECDSRIVSGFQIWRRVDSNPFEPGNCDVGMPEGTGYELVDIVGNEQTGYLDDDNGFGLSPGAQYCYRIVAVFRDPQGGESYVSNEVCATVVAEAPVITKVSVLETDQSNGEIEVEWLPPFDLTDPSFPPPYNYKVYRFTGFNGGANKTLVYEGSQTSFVDAGFDTENQPYHYQIELFDSNNNFVDTSAFASSVYLDIASGLESQTLSWSADVPWTNVSDEYPYHRIYRNNVNQNDPDQLVLIDSVNVIQSGLNYIDDGSFNNTPLVDSIEYCYVVRTSGTYGNPDIPEPLFNFSQRACAFLSDSIPPCPPLDLTINNLDVGSCEDFLFNQPCDFDDYFNELSWDINLDDECEEDVRLYNIYYSSTGEDGTFSLVGTTREPRFNHVDLNEYAGCYYITAIDRSGNESEPSNIVCRDNCPYYELPNVFTPNGDGFNDTFEAYSNQQSDFTKCPRFVESVEFKVFNSHGKEVYSYTSGNEKSILINWNGEGSNGQVLNPGVYYYIAKVRFRVLDPSKKEREYKGWVHLLE
ncbi:T9SS type B sorting domain-containing protein [Marinigracilibium pacificum]|uniref:Gliding motility-associated C-terminal domain-containing protein n=1 Tax=Marinigracilibium pacificum TaxID=2729599 RepID=A0A848J398_9BACT|nr:gliding motility-associated C-terminal domain-containing protein [Marinigracilibium pacificum]NMM50201.1 gliding motility-associated C-terminal domain-containing protein [Marinigracilibium pacificum]